MPAGVSISRSEKQSAQNLQRFLDSSPEPHHATYQSVKKLKELKVRAVKVVVAFRKGLILDEPAGLRLYSHTPNTHS